MIFSRKASLYLKGLSAGTVTMMVNLVTGFTNLWLMTNILEKPEYGALAFAQAWIVLLRLLSTLGLDRTLLYRVAALERVEGKLVGGGIVASTILFVAISSAVFTAATLGGVAVLQDMFNLEPFWFFVFSSTIPFMAISAVLSAWHVANDRAYIAQIVSMGVGVTQMFALIIAWVAVPSGIGVATAVIIGALMSVLLWLPIIRGEKFGPVAILSWQDWSYGSKLLITKVAYEGITKVDVVMLGLMTTTSTVAEYSVAKRLAELANIGNRLLSPVFTPRMRYALAAKDKYSLMNEYRQNRFLESFSALFVLGMYLVLGQTLLGIFGDFTGAWAALLVLVGGVLVGNLFGASGRYLNMAGYANLSLYTTAGLVAVNIIFNLWLIQLLGGSGAALATATSILIVNSIIAFLIWKVDCFPTLNLSIAVAICSAVLGTWWWAVVPTTAALMPIVCVGVAGVFLVMGEFGVAKSMVLKTVDMHKPKKRV